tara:strand:+ start:277 stop:1008 length:732 start_codon:yes stop_codon:yes gene_type:complete
LNPSIDIIIPVHNEENVLLDSIRRLNQFLQGNIQNPWRITIADNASTDATRSIAQLLAQDYPGVGYLFIPEKGRGRALRASWLNSTADFVSYMDVDLSTDLTHVPELIAALESGFHIAIGNRLNRKSEVTRGFKREIISRCYNALIKGLFFTSFSDAQCGFKALNRRTAATIVPHVVNNNWFFDTELLILAAKRGYQIKSLPVTWIDDPESSVNITSTVKEDLKGLFRLRFRGIPKITGPIDV